MFPSAPFQEHARLLSAHLKALAGSEGADNWIRAVEKFEMNYGEFFGFDSSRAWA